MCQHLTLRRVANPEDQPSLPYIGCWECTSCGEKLIARPIQIRVSRGPARIRATQPGWVLLDIDVPTLVLGLVTWQPIEFVIDDRSIWHPQPLRADAPIAIETTLPICGYTQNDQIAAPRKPSPEKK